MCVEFHMLQPSTPCGNCKVRAFCITLAPSPSGVWTGMPRHPHCPTAFMGFKKKARPRKHPKHLPVQLVSSRGAPHAHCLYALKSVLTLRSLQAQGFLIPFSCFHLPSGGRLGLGPPGWCGLFSSLGAPAASPTNWAQWSEGRVYPARTVSFVKGVVGE